MFLCPQQGYTTWMLVLLFALSEVEHFQVDFWHNRSLKSGESDRERENVYLSKP